MRTPSLRRRRAPPPLTTPPRALKMPPPPAAAPPRLSVAAADGGGGSGGGGGAPESLRAYADALGARMCHLGAPPTTSFADSYAGEFDALLEADRRAAREVARFSAGAAVEAVLRNRYSNVLANDHSRVRLKIGAGCDYVNANRIGSGCCGDGGGERQAGAEGSGGYIATQAPTVETFAHFWQMVVENGAGVIVMLTREFEGRGGTVKSDRYWPEPGAECSYGGYVVRCLGVSGVDEPITERRFEVAAAARHGAPLVVTHLQYVDWPDQDVPDSPRALLDLRLRAARYNASTPSSPVVVHCSAGVGRTGTYIAVDQILRRVRAVYGDPAGGGDGGGVDDGEVLPAAAGEAVEDIYECVFKLKLARSKMVQTWEQYRFIFDAVYAGVEAMIAGANMSQQPFARRAASVATDDDETGGLGPELRLNNMLPAAPVGAGASIPSVAAVAPGAGSEGERN